MKKLLTILVSAASACFAFAENTFTGSGTSFGDTTVNATEGITFDITAGDAELAGTENAGVRFWYSLASGTDVDYGIITNYESNTVSTPIASRPGMWANVANKNYLKLDTSDTLFRSIDGLNNDYTAPKTVNIGDGIYFDSLVQFTATEDDVTHTAGDKLVVWLKAVDTVPAEGENEEVPGYTNLIITAGNGKAADGTANATNFVASGVNIAPNSWHRLTIKAFYEESSDSTFFNVYIDGGLVSGVLEGEQPVTKFESLVATGMTAYNTISAVGFKGNGAVDDLAFTTDNPLVQTFPLSIVVPQGSEVITCFVGEDNEIEAKDGVYLIDVTATADVKAWVSVPDGYKVTNDGATYDETGKYWVVPVSITGATANTPFSFTVTVEANEVPAVKPFSITIAGVTTAYETLAKAFAAAEAGATIKLTANATVDEWLKVDKNVVLDLNGCILTEEVDPEDSDYGAIYVKLGCQLTITDSSKDKNGKIASNGDIVIGNYGKVIVEAGTIESGDVRDNDVSIYNMNYAGTHVGTATINGGAVESVWNCGTITVAADASVTYLDNSGAATIAAGAKVAKVVLMDGKDAQGVKDAGTITAPETLVVESGVEDYTATWNEGVWSLVAESDDPEPELPTPGVAEGEEINQTYEDEAKAAIKDAFTTGGTFTPPPALVVEVNGEVLLGNAAVEMINEVTKVFDITEGKFFDANGKMEVTFKATSADPAKITYEAKVGEANATVDAAYEVVPKYIDLATGKETTPAQDATAKFFKLVIRAKSVQ